VATEAEERVAEDIGRLLAQAGAVLVCGGMTGVMEAACKGAREEGGATVGLLPGEDRAQANAYVSVALPTGLGEMRNALIVRAADAVIAVAGEYGTLSEIALALKTGVPVVGVETWDLERGPRGAIERATSAAQAVKSALRLARGSTRSVSAPP
jgi:uncharacterized protein (TIGR00725 family)